jgi:hypothetical protein
MWAQTSTNHPKIHDVKLKPHFLTKIKIKKHIITKKHSKQRKNGGQRCLCNKV